MSQDDEGQTLKILSGRVRSGLARAEALPASRRVEIARKAAAARWGGAALKATHKGSFKTEFGRSLAPSFVLAHEDAPPVFRGVEALAAFRDSVSMSVIPPSADNTIEKRRP